MSNPAYNLGNILQASRFFPCCVSVSNIDGANRVVKAAPIVPIPKIPRAVPCFCLGYHNEV